MICLHCGNNKPYSREGYCENCFQELFTENFKLRLKVIELESKIKHKPKHMKE